MLRRRRIRTSLLALTVLALTAGAGTGLLDAHAGKEPDGRIELTAHLEPADLAPGQTGFLVVEAKIENELHVYATKDEALRVKAKPEAGVTFGLPEAGLTWSEYEKNPGKVSWSKPHLFQDPNYSPEDLPPYPVWDPEHALVLKIPVTLGASVKPKAELALAFEYSGCDDLMCYGRVLDHVVVAKLGAAAPPAQGGGRKVSVGQGLQDRSASVTLEIRDGKDGGHAAVVTFAPAPGFHLYLPPGSEEGGPITVEPQKDEGITWGAFAMDESGEPFEEPYEVHVPFTRAGGERIRIFVSWQGCDARNCFFGEGTLEARWAAEAADPPPPLPMVDPGTEAPGAEPAVEIAEGEHVLVKPSKAVPYPVVLNDDLSKPRRDDDWRVVASVSRPESDLEKKWKQSWILFLGTVFLFGVGLAFTPCVLPIIPLTISVIGGGNPDLPKSRLTLMLTVYVLGLSLTYGLAGAVSGSLGEAIDIDAAFKIPAVVWAIGIFFLVMAAGMLGIFELQPPAWMEKMRGGAAQKSGTMVGSFLLGCLAAVIASPCTGPFVVAMLTFVATMGSPFVGFVLFFMLGLGMGAVFFAAGSLNLLARPGPWMIWVRYAFGIILVGVALYFLASAGMISTTVLFVAGFLIAALSWFMISRHLQKREGEKASVANQRGAVLAVCLVVVTGLVAFLTRPPGAVGEGQGWIKLKDVAHLKKELERARDEGRPAVVDVWAQTCFYCKEFDKVIAGDDELEKAFGELVMLKIDETSGSKDAMRKLVGLPTTGQPRMVFFDEKGRIRRALDVAGWFGSHEASAMELRRRADFLLRRNEHGASKESARVN